MNNNYIGFRLSEELLKKLEQLASENHRSISGQIRHLLEVALSNK